MAKINLQKAGIGIMGVAAFAVLALPVINVSAATTDVEVTANIDSSLTLSASTPSTVSLTPTTTADEDAATGTVTVATNDEDGYNLAISATTPALQHDTLPATTIPVAAGTVGTPAALTDNTWGFRVSSWAAGTYAGVTTTATNIKTTATPNASDVTNVAYGVRANSSQASGNYATDVTYTALVN